MTNPTALAPCLKCAGERTRRRGGRGLCLACYSAERRNGHLDRWPLGAGGPARHGSFTLAIKKRCDCDPCKAYYRKFYDRQNRRNRAERERTETAPTVIKQTQQPFTIGNPDNADTVLIERITKGNPVAITHPDDRAGVIAAVVSGEIGRNAALKALRCSSTALDAAINELHKTAA